MSNETESKNKTIERKEITWTPAGDTQKGLAMKRHELKIWPEYFDPVEAGLKTFEIRKNDRGFAMGDRLLLREFFPGGGVGGAGFYTGRELEARISYLTDFAQQPGWVVFGIRILSRACPSSEGDTQKVREAELDPRRSVLRPQPKIGERQREVLALIRSGCNTPQALISALGVSAPRVSVLCKTLEARGLLEAKPLHYVVLDAKEKNECFFIKKAQNT